MGRVSEAPYTGLSPQLSKFLQHMQQEQIVQVKELSKGVESIVAVDWRHPRITSFVVPEPSLASQTVQGCSRGILYLEGDRAFPCYLPGQSGKPDLQILEQAPGCSFRPLEDKDLAGALSLHLSYRPGFMSPAVPTCKRSTQLGLLTMVPPLPGPPAGGGASREGKGALTQVCGPVSQQVHAILP